MATKVLVVEDERNVRLLLKRILEDEGFLALLAQDANEAFSIAIDSRPDLVLSDVGLKGMDGFALCRELKWDRRTADIPIILLSGAHTEEEAQVKGLEYGADDYLLKPISPKFLVSKIRTVLRRYAAPDELQNVLTVEDLTLDVKAWTVSVKDKVILLTRKEFDLLLMFLRKRGRVLRPAFLLETVWGLDPTQHTDFRTIKVHISSLRKKLGTRLGKKIVNVPGVGYRFDA